MIQNAALLKTLWINTFTQAYAEVHTAANIQTYCQNNFTLEKATQQLLDKNTVCVIAKKGPKNKTQATGFYLIKRQDCPVTLDGKAVELKQIYILANEYGTGLGQLLYQDALKTARQHSAEWIWLSVSDINFRAQAFYKKHGFASIGTGPVFSVGDDQLTSTLMAKRIEVLEETPLF